jgi:hypothetical protein
MLKFDPKDEENISLPKQLFNPLIKLTSGLKEFNKMLKEKNKSTPMMKYSNNNGDFSPNDTMPLFYSRYKHISIKAYGGFSTISLSLDVTLKFFFFFLIFK